MDRFPDSLIPVRRSFPTMTQAPSGKPMEGLVRKAFLDSPTREPAAVGSVLGHSFHPQNARRPRSTSNLRPVYSQGRAPHPVLPLTQ